MAAYAPSCDLDSADWRRAEYSCDRANGQLPSATRVPRRIQQCYPGSSNCTNRSHGRETGTSHITASDMVVPLCCRLVFARPSRNGMRRFSSASRSSSAAVRRAVFPRRDVKLGIARRLDAAWATTDGTCGRSRDDVSVSARTGRGCGSLHFAEGSIQQQKIVPIRLHNLAPRGRSRCSIPDIRTHCGASGASKRVSRKTYVCRLDTEFLTRTTTMSATFSRLLAGSLPMLWDSQVGPLGRQPISLREPVLRSSPAPQRRSGRR
jgi:hypothetical protein